MPEIGKNVQKTCQVLFLIITLSSYVLFTYLQHFLQIDNNKQQKSKAVYQGCQYRMG